MRKLTAKKLVSVLFNFLKKIHKLVYELKREKYMIFTEAATRGVLQEKVFLGISQNSQENTCDRVSFLIKLQAQVFFCESCDIFKNTYFTEHLWTTAFGW